jgi:predicted  nucleic acid-binding Zn-ribbon protein
MTTSESYHTTYDADAGTTGDAADCYVDLDGVTARKSKTLTDDGILQLEFVVHSTRSEPVRLEIRDALPHGFPLDRVGFCPDYGQENWSVGDGHELVYESELEPQGDERTVYAVKPNEQFDPPLFSIGAKVTAEVNGDRAPADTGNDPHTDTPEMETANPVSDGEGEAIEAGPDDEVEPFDLADPKGVATTDSSTRDRPTSSESMQAEQSTQEPVADGAVDEVASAAGSGSTSVTMDAEATQNASRTPSSGTHEDRDATTDEGILARLTAELEEKRASDEELAALEEHLSRLTTDRRDGRTSLEARLQRAERELNELSAYTDALSEFLDERGAGQELLDELETQAAEVQSRLTDVSDEVSALDERLETVEAREERLDAFDDRFGDVVDRLDEITDRLDDIDDRQDGSSERLDAVDDRLDDLDDRQAATTDRLETVTGRLDSVDEHVGKLDDELTVLRNHHEEAAERITRTQESVDALDDRLDTAETERAARNEALSEELDSVAEEVEELRRWHQDFGRLLDDFAAFGRESTGGERGETPEETTGAQRRRPFTNGAPPSETDASTDGGEAAAADEGEPTNDSSQLTDTN